MTLHTLARTYGGRPSGWVGDELDPEEAFVLDLEVLQAGLTAEQQARERAERKARMGR